MAQTGKNTDRAAELLAEGKLVAIPTETVYGLAANALNEKAVLSIFEVKQRPFFDPLIVHLPAIEKVDLYAVWNDPLLKKLALKFWPGPLTILLPKKEMIPGIVTSGLQQVALRIPDHVLTLDLLSKINFPLAAPSANPFGYVSPTEASHVNKQLGDKVEYILDGGPCTVGLESTIVGAEDGKICVYRLGGLAVEEIEKETGKVELRINQSGDPKAPGQLKSHYAPRKPLVMGNIGQLIELNRGKKIGVICFGKNDLGDAQVKIFNLSEEASLEEAAINLFRYLRQADESDLDVIIAGELPDKGLGKAINDRLRRASS
jgi:L-threonylcarbamoyladenylate synthase